MSWPRMGRFSFVLACLIAWALLASPSGAAPLAQEGQAAITAPAANTQVSGMLQIIGSATHPDFARYELAWAREPLAAETVWAVFASLETPIQDGVLSVWNTSQAPDGMYALRLRVVRHDSNFQEVMVHGLEVRNSQPLNTPTPAVGPTIPPEPTAGAVTSTPELIVQPPTSTPQPATPTPASGGADDTPAQRTSTEFSINFSSLGQSFCDGATYALGAFLLWGAALGARGGLRWVLRRLARREQKSL